MSGKRKNGETLEELRNKPFGWWRNINLSDNEKERLKRLDTASVPWHRQLRNCFMELDDQIFIRDIFKRYIDTLQELKDKAIGYCYIFSKGSLHSSFRKRLMVSIAYDSGKTLVGIPAYCDKLEHLDINKWNTPLGKVLREYILSEDRFKMYLNDVETIKFYGTVSIPLFKGKAKNNIANDVPMSSFALHTSSIGQAIGFVPSAFKFKDINDNLQGKLYVE
jgi:hypothetical protein